MRSQSQTAASYGKLSCCHHDGICVVVHTWALNHTFGTLLQHVGTSFSCIMFYPVKCSGTILRVATCVCHFAVHPLRPHTTLDPLYALLELHSQRETPPIWPALGAAHKLIHDLVGRVRMHVVLDCIHLHGLFTTILLSTSSSAHKAISSSPNSVSKQLSAA